MMRKLHKKKCVGVRKIHIWWKFSTPLVSRSWQSVSLKEVQVLMKESWRSNALYISLSKWCKSEDVVSTIAVPDRLFLFLIWIEKRVYIFINKHCYHLHPQKEMLHGFQSQSGLNLVRYFILVSIITVPDWLFLSSTAILTFS